MQDLYTLGLAETGEGGGLVQRATRWVESLTLRAADTVAVIHDRFAAYVTDELGVNSSKVVVVRNWTHLKPSKAIDPRTAKKALGWPTDVTLAVHTGNMGAKQGLHNVVEAARLADEIQAPVHFFLIGDGSERKELEQQALGIGRLSFTDPLSDSDYLLALSAADILVLNEKPGVAAMAVPSKLTSYFDAGKPVVAATDGGGITAAEIKSSEAGVVVPAGNPDELLRVIIKLGSDSAACAQYGRNGRHYRETVLDESAAISQWADIVANAQAHKRLRTARGAIDTLGQIPPPTRT
ncbi:hypothetical protein MPRF_56760 [Mycolicibacterium parafortuitum]|uniref:Glycosyl transferase family 1 domain-containing protein n=1 Tax=Mycolicibacterium parafortuitum TaxID=39692 RepID=A0A7I7UC07_MYCPF|nr:hypothetical protein MPRF_56760 [Mycolicibacterium parafortuitum]